MEMYIRKDYPPPAWGRYHDIYPERDLTAYRWPGLPPGYTQRSRSCRSNDILRIRSLMPRINEYLIEKSIDPGYLIWMDTTIERVYGKKWEPEPEHRGYIIWITQAFANEKYQSAAQLLIMFYETEMALIHIMEA